MICWIDVEIRRIENILLKPDIVQKLPDQGAALIERRDFLRKTKDAPFNLSPPVAPPVVTPTNTISTNANAVESSHSTAPISQEASSVSPSWGLWGEETRRKKMIEIEEGNVQIMSKEEMAAHRRALRSRDDDKVSLL
eukprot:PhF_6_TR39844/c0_g1_i1/m.59247